MRRSNVKAVRAFFLAALMLLMALPSAAPAQLIGGVPAVIILGKAWTPQRLFAAGERGAWYDPSDLSSMCQDSTCTTPAAVNSPVGKIFDKSGNGYNLTQGTSSARPVLRQVGSLYYLDFDGVDDKLVASGSALDLFKNVSVGSLFIGATVATVVQAQPGIFGWSIGPSTATRAAILPNSAALQAGGRRLDADTFASANAAAVLSANTPFIASALFDWGNATVTLRKDRSQVAQNASFQTAGPTENVSSNAAGISAVSGFSSGRFYGGIALQRIPDAGTLVLIENYLGSKTGI